MSNPEVRRITSKDLLDLAIAIIPVAALLAIQYRDEIKQFQLWVERRINRKPYWENEALQQVQKEISWMEHGEFGEVEDAD